MFYQNYCIIANKIGFYAKEPYSLLKPHVVIIGLAWGGTLSTLCTHGIALLIIQSTMKNETTTTTMTMLRTGASWTTSTAYGWCNAPRSVLCRFEHSRQICIITILGHPPGITCTSQHTRYAGGIVITLQQFSMEPQKNIYNNDSPSQEQQRYNTKIQITTEVN